MTLWGEEFAGMINNKGRYDGEGDLTNYKDHGFGFSLGMDAGSARDGWYGGALTFYSSDVIETLPRQSIRICNGTCSPAIPTGAATISSSTPRSTSPTAISTASATCSSATRTGSAEGKRASLLGSAGRAPPGFLQIWQFRHHAASQPGRM